LNCYCRSRLQNIFEEFIRYPQVKILSRIPVTRHVIVKGTENKVNLCSPVTDVDLQRP